MHIAILTFDGYNELDSLIALGILNRAATSDWRVSIASPTATVTSMNGVMLHSQATLAEAVDADAGVDVLDQPFFARGNVATAGGCLASQYLAAWMIARLDSLDAAAAAMHYVAPVGEKDEYVARALDNIRPYLEDEAAAATAAAATAAPVPLQHGVR